SASRTPRAVPSSSLDRSAPEERRRNRAAGGLLARHRPELAHRGPDLRGLAAERLEDEAGVVRQPAGAESDPGREIDPGARARVDAIGDLLRREQDHVAEDVEWAHHARLAHRTPRGVDHQLL